jgi:hypothetical protein
MNKLLKEREPMYVSDTKNCARQIVRESLNDILAGKFQIPSLEEMESILAREFEHTFDEYIARLKIIRSHLEWSTEQVQDELERQKRHFENELRVNLRVAALKSIEEIERLIRSLNQAITGWKVENL